MLMPEGRVRAPVTDPASYVRLVKGAKTFRPAFTVPMIAMTSRRGELWLIVHFTCGCFEKVSQRRLQYNLKLHIGFVSTNAVILLPIAQKPSGSFR